MKACLMYTILCALPALLLSCTDAHDRTNLKDLKPQQFQSFVQSRQGTLLDVRTPKEYAEGHITQSENIDYKDSNFELALENLDKNEPYFVYCKSGVRSSKAGETMQELGFTQVYLLDGGIDA